MESHYISVKGSTFHYRKFGNGSKPLFCFHGYGRESDSFYFLEKRIGKIYTIIALDSPFHGLTKWDARQHVDPNSLSEIMDRIAEQHRVGNQKFSILGFSMGGRIALFLTQLIPWKIERLVLIAPDGLSFNFWRSLFTNTTIGRKILFYTIKNPGWALWLLHFFERNMIIHKSQAEFIGYYLNDTNHRQLLFQRWISLHKFNPDLGRIKKKIRKYNICVRMMFGIFDRVIPAASGNKFIEGIEENATIQLVQTGHNLLSEMQAGKIADLFTR